MDVASKESSAEPIIMLDIIDANAAAQRDACTKIGSMTGSVIAWMCAALHAGSSYSKVRSV